jgi:hypothetical protein
MAQMPKEMRIAIMPPEIYWTVSDDCLAIAIKAIKAINLNGIPIFLFISALSSHWSLRRPFKLNHYLAAGRALI